MNRHNIHYSRPVEAFERYDDPEIDCTVLEAAGLLIVTLVGAGTLFVAMVLFMVML